MTFKGEYFQQIFGIIMGTNVVPILANIYLTKLENLLREKSKTDKKIFATGDLDQLQPFGFQLNNVQDKKEYLKRIFDMMFPNQIILEHNKRLKTEEDKLKLRQFKITEFVLLSIFGLPFSSKFI